MTTAMPNYRPSRTGGRLRLWHCAVPEGTNGGWRQKTMRRAAVAEHV